MCIGLVWLNVEIVSLEPLQVYTVLHMSMSMTQVGLHIIESDDGDYRDDRTALVAILRAMLLEMQVGLAVKPTATEA
jgi:hypothetical protein